VLGHALRAGVVFFVVDIPRRTILFTIDLRFFSGGQLAAIGGAVGADLLIDPALLIFQSGRFARGQLPALHALGDAVLLILAALARLLFP
jgi:hypothetical protein